jgi:hypothetical protein
VAFQIVIDYNHLKYTRIEDHSMQQRIFHGKITPNQLGRALVGEFNQGNLCSQQIGNQQEVIVQIGTSQFSRSGGETALTVTLRQVADGVAVQIGNQAWLGVAASLGKTALQVWRNPFALIERLDDLAQDIESLKLSEQVWDVIENTARSLGANFELSERLRRIVCEYCQVANPVGEPACIACGAPLGRAQPRTCPNCGFVLKAAETTCPNCGQKISNQ